MKNKKSLIIFVIAILLCLLGTTYAFFNYYMEGANQEIVAGEVTMVLNDGYNTLTLTNMLPETIEEARAEGRTDNVLLFTINSNNTTTNKDIYYEIMLNEGDNKSGKTRINPEHLVFDLIEVNSDDDETLLVDAMSYNEFNKERIWVDKIESGSTNFTKIYKLRVWLKENLLISDTDPNADYKASDFANSYASIKVSVYGDFKEKSSPYNYMKRIGVINMEAENEMEAFKYWSDEIEAVKTNITEVNFVSMKQNKMQERYTAATIKEDMTDTTKSEEGSVLAWLEPSEIVDIEGTETQLYKMYVASEGTTLFPSDSSGMFGMFMGLTKINFKNINTQYVENMGYMFAFCASLQNVDVSSFETKNVNTLEGMFGACSSLNTLDLSKFDTGNVTSINALAIMCSNLTSINLSGWNIENITVWDMPFGECPNLTNVNLSNWKLGMNYVDIKTLVADLTNLNLNLSGWDVKYLLMLDGMFAEWTNLVSLDLSNWNTKYIMSMSGMFSGCTNLITLNLSGWNTENVTNMSNMFEKCGLTSLDISHFNTTNVTNMSNMFAWCQNLINLDVSHFNTSSVIDMSGMFDWCWSLKTLNVSDWDTSNVTDMSGMFGVIGLMSGGIDFLDLSKWDTSSVKDMSYMFAMAEIYELDVSNFNTKQVNNMSGMFEEFTTDSILDLSSFETSNVTKMWSMFNLARIPSIDISNFTFSDTLKSDSNNYSTMFSTNGISKIIVKSTAEREWILSTFTGLSSENVVVKS